MLTRPTIRQLGVISSRVISRFWACRYRTANTSVSIVHKGINVDWAEGDGKKLRKDFFHGIWLRHNCQCPLCYNIHSDQYIVEADELPNVRVTRAEVNGDNLDLAWKNDTVQHKGFIPLEWLKQHHYPAQNEPIKEKAEYKSGIPKITKVPMVEYEKVMTGDEGLWRWLRNLKVHGMCIVEGVPTVPETVIPLGEKISGYLHETMYGKIFDVVTSDKPVNIAYGDGKLPLHMDQVYYESPPGLQLLHCLINEPAGGESLLLDTYPVLEELREKHPEEFCTLTRVPTTFQRVHYKRDPPVHLVTQIPHIILGKNDEIVGFRWSQGLRGPLHVPADDVEPYYKAYTLLAKMLKTSDRLLEFRLLPGQVMSIDNRRVLHGRQHFSATDGARHLQGCYVNYDEFNSRFETLKRVYGH